VAGERVIRLSDESGVSPGTLHLWKRQALIDAGLKPGTKSVEVDELAQARRTIEELEAELAAVKAPSAAADCLIAAAAAAAAAAALPLASAPLATASVDDFPVSEVEVEHRPSTS
jgi:transposase-like protein